MRFTAGNALATGDWKPAAGYRELLSHRSMWYVALALLASRLLLRPITLFFAGIMVAAVVFRYWRAFPFYTSRQFTGR